MAQNYCPPAKVDLPFRPEDCCSSLAWRENILGAGTWDGKVELCHVIDQKDASLDDMALSSNHVASLTAGAPVLSLAMRTEWGAAVVGTAANEVVNIDMEKGSRTLLGKHDMPVKAVVEISPEVLVSGGWDGLIKFWDLRQGGPVCTHKTPGRIFDIDHRNNTIAVITSERRLELFSARDIAQPPYLAQDAVLKQPLRSVGVFQDGSGVVVAGVEGRCAIVNTAQPSKNFAFKCHRRTVPRQDLEIFPINVVKFHPLQQTFFTAGGDGAFNTWDHVARQRLGKFEFSRETLLPSDAPPDFAHIPIPAAAINGTGDLLAYAKGYDFHRGTGPSEYSPEDATFSLYVQKVAASMQRRGRE